MPVGLAHLWTGGVKIEEIEQLLAGAGEEQKTMIIKIGRAVDDNLMFHITIRYPVFGAQCKRTFLRGNLI